MKTVIYRCDCNDCKNETNSIERSKWIELGGENGTLFVNNFLQNRKLISIQNYNTIHFCSWECVTKYFTDNV